MQKRLRETFNFYFLWYKKFQLNNFRYSVSLVGVILTTPLVFFGLVHLLSGQNFYRIGLTIPRAQSAGVSFVQSKTAMGNAVSGSILFDSNTGSGNLVVVSITSSSGNTPINTPTDIKNNSYTTAVSGGSGTLSKTFYASNISGGSSHQINFSFGWSVEYSVAISEYSGVEFASMLDGVSFGSGNSTTCDSGQINTVNNDNLIYSYGHVVGVRTTLSGAGFTKRADAQGVSLRFSTEDKTVNTAGTYSAGFSLNVSGSWHCHIVAFKALVTVPSPVSDTSPPSIPNSLSAVPASATQINLTWSASNDNVGVTGYRVLRNGSQIGSTSNTSYSNTGLLPSTTYSYTVLAYDAAGNVSVQSGQASSTTQAVLTPPVITAFFALPTSISLGGSVTLSWSVSGATALSIDQGVGVVTGSSRSVSPIITTTYILTATNSVGPSTAQTTVTVAGTAPIATGDFDQYGGYTKLKCRGGVKLNFYTEKNNNRWVFCTPAGNIFFLKGVYNMTAASNYTAKYGSSLANWSPEANKRIQSWGFNSTAEYSSSYIFPSWTSSFWPGDRYNPVKLPFTPLIRPSYYGLLNRNGYASNPVKEILQATRADVYTGWRAWHTPDIFDPNYKAYAIGMLQNNSEYNFWYKGPYKDYLIGLVIDDTDWFAGLGAGPDYGNLDNGKLLIGGRSQPHLGWLVWVTKPTQAGNTEFSLTYADTKVYSKEAFANFLQSRYGTVSSLNTAWGSAYTTFGSAGSWGAGTGFLDEDGLHSWVPKDYLKLSDATLTVKNDLDAFLKIFAEKYFADMKSVVDTVMPGYLFLGPTYLGTWGTPPRKEVLQAAAPYVDVLQVYSVPPGANDDQVRADFIAQHFGDKPWITWEGFMAQADSAFYSRTAPSQVRSVDTTQNARGAHYLNILNNALNLKTQNGSYPLAGLKFWEYNDNNGEGANWGLVTMTDNAYDGKEAKANAQSCSSGYMVAAGYFCGGEARNYGDFLTTVTTANNAVYSVLASQVGASITSPAVVPPPPVVPGPVLPGAPAQIIPSAGGGPGGGVGGTGSASIVQPSVNPNAKQRLVNVAGTFYLINQGRRMGITNPGILYSYGFEFKDAKTATKADIALPEESLVLPGNGYLVKSSTDTTVWLISNGQRYGFVSVEVFNTLGFNFRQVLVVTDPELQTLPKASNIDNAQAAHLDGVTINDNGTIYWVNQGRKHGFPSLLIYNSWYKDNDFSQVVPANQADRALTSGDLVVGRVLD